MLNTNPEHDGLAGGVRPRRLDCNEGLRRVFIVYLNYRVGGLMFGQKPRQFRLVCFGQRTSGCFRAQKCRLSERRGRKDHRIVFRARLFVQSQPVLEPFRKLKSDPFVPDSIAVRKFEPVVLLETLWLF